MSHTISERKRRDREIELGGRKHWYVEHLEQQRDGQFARPASTLARTIYFGNRAKGRSQ